MKSVAYIHPDSALPRGSGQVTMRRAIIAGTGSLAIRCAESIMRSAVELVAVITSESSLRQWANSHGIECCSSATALTSSCALQSIDYLFSIVNGRILTAEECAMPRAMCVNYHDAPLPRYAGVHATSWAIANGETMHGVSWHIMTPEIDAGPVVKQRAFPISDNETAQSLNLKCFEAAIETFGELLTNIETDTVTPISQDLTHRLYYGRHDKLVTAGVLRWDESAADLFRVCRALDFGATRNRLGCVRIRRGQAYWMVRRASVRQPGTDAPPGTVVELSTTHVVVATADGDLVIHELATLEGDVADPSAVGFSLGEQLPRADRSEQDALHKLSVDCSRNEGYWFRSLARASSGDVEIAATGEEPFVRAVMSVPERLMRAIEDYATAEQCSVLDVLSAAAAWYCRRLTRTQGNEISFLRASPDAADAQLCVTWLPVTVACHERMSARELVRDVNRLADDISRHGPMLRDMVGRTPEVQHDRLSWAFAISQDPDAIVNSTPLCLAVDASRSPLTLSVASRHDVMPDLLCSLWLRCVEAMVLNRHQPLVAVTLLDEAERSAMVGESWKGETAWAGGTVAAVQAMAAQQPTAVAVQAGPTTWTYEALMAASARVADALRALGVAPGDVVAVQLERSAELVATLLGLWTVGAVYCPIDLTQPAARRAAMVAQARPRVTVGPTADTPGPGLDWARMARWPRAAGAPAVVPPQLPAYVLFTSGSTGTPKGVVCTHEALWNRVAWSVTAYGLTPADALLHNAAPGFDIAVWEMMAPLISGGRVVVLPAAATGDVAAMGALVQAASVTTLHLVPALMRLYLEAVAATTSRTLRVLITGGDVVPPAVRTAWQQVLPQAALYQAYGPTEATISVTHATVAATETGPLPLGRPVAQAEVYVLDRWLAPVPPGVAGDLWLGGTPLALGYAHAPGATAARFVAHPFRPGARLYRTGDLGRWRGDGQLEYLGRTDRQVKIRGQRVELGEIETALTAVPGIAEAVVALQPDASGTGELVAWVTGPGGQQSTAALQAALATRLPPALVPTHFIPMATWPLTPHGKIDRRALPPPTRFANTNQLAVPQTEMERVLIAIWSRLQGREDFSIESNFFEHGASSLTASALVAAIASELRVRVSLSDVLHRPSIKELSAFIESGAPCADQPHVLHSADVSERPFNLSQQEIWNHAQFLPDAAYNVPIAFRIHGPIDPERMCLAFGETFNSHPGLKTYVASSTERLELATAPSDAQLPLEVRSTETEVSAADVTVEARRPFNLTEGPLLRTVLWRAADNNHVLLMLFHHFVADGWSIGRFVREWCARYNGGYRDLRAEADVPRFEDLALAQRGPAYTALLASQRTVWEARLLEIEDPLLHMLRRSPGYSSGQGSVVQQRLDAKLVDAIERLASSHNGTLFTTLLTVFSALMARFAHAERYGIGTVFANRRNPGLNEMIGPLANAVLLPMASIGRPALTEALRATTTTVMWAADHQELPFSHVARTEDGLAREMEVMFLLNPEWRAEFRLEGTTSAPFPVHNGSAMFGLTVSAEKWRQGDGLVLEWEYASDLFSAPIVESLAANFEQLLRAAVAAPGLSLADVDLNTPEQSHLDSGRLPDRVETTTILDQFETMAARAPAAIAVTDERRSLSYGALNARANQLARVIERSSAEGNGVVAVILEPDCALTTALLAVLKSGQAYVAFDSRIATETLTAQLRHCQPGLIVTTVELSEKCVSPAPMVLIDRDHELIDDGSSENLPDRPAPYDLAQVVYTSGSTGAPKAVEVQHASLAHYIAAAREEFGLTSIDAVFQFASIGFDASSEEIYSALTSGARLVMHGHEWPVTPQALLEYCRAERVTVLDLPTAYWHQLVDDLASHNLTLPPNIRLVVIGGERLRPDKLRLWRSMVPDVRIRLLNTYGPTEATIVSTWCRLEEQANADLAPIGVPVPGTVAFIVDANLRPIPSGGTGELLLAGAGLARGYRNDTEQTATRFPIIRAGAREIRVFRTGDLVRRDSNGELHYLGRTDRTVKVRGKRVDLDYIEEVFARVAGVCGVAATIHTTDSGGDVVLVGLVLSDDDLPRVEGEARAALAGDAYPDRVVTVPALPRLLNGKLNRAALVAVMGQARAGVSVVGCDAIAAEVLLAFRRVLDAPELAIDDNFFAAGGHSMAALQVGSLLAGSGLRVALRDVFRAPTPRTLAERLRGDAMAQPPAREEDSWPLSPMQRQIYFAEFFEGKSGLYHVPCVYRWRGALRPKRLAAAFSAVVSRHDALRANLVSVDDEIRQTFDAAPTMQFAFLQSDETRDAFVRELVEKPMLELSTPLVRACCVSNGPDEHTLVVVFHHLIADGWSTDLFARDLSDAYASQPGALKPTVQFTDVLRRETEPTAVLERAASVEWWRQQLAGVPEAINLPCQLLPRTTRRDAAGDQIRWSLDAGVLKRVRQFAASSSCSVAAVLFATLSAWLHRISGDEDVVVGVVTSRRFALDAVDTFGPLLAMVAVRSRLTSSSTFTHVVADSTERLFDAQDHSDAPFDRVVDALACSRDPQRHPVFQVAFTTYRLSQAIELDGLKCEPVAIRSAETKFDLSLNVEEGNDSAVLVFDYRTDRLSTELMRELTAGFRMLLQHCLAAPNVAIGQLPMLAAARFEQLSISPDDPREDVTPVDVHRWAAITPDAIALSCGDVFLTFAELQRRSNALASRLVSLGVQRGDAVIVCSEPSPAHVIALLAVIEAGFAYTPVDPAWPAERRAFVVHDARAAVVLASASLAQAMAVGTTLVIELESVVSEEGTSTRGAKLATLCDAAPVYITYTSGSTGVPKGVVNTHAGLANRLAWCASTYEIGPGDSLLQIAPIGFDISIWEMLFPLLSGARLVVPQASSAHEPAMIMKTLEIERVTIVHFVPSLLSAILDYAGDSLPRSITQVICGGEQLSPALLARFHAASAARLHHAYGPTEAAISVTHWESRSSRELGTVPLGRPISNTQVYVLNEALVPVAPGVTGELYLAGMGLAQGYVRRRGLTATRFVANPFRPGERMYRTGDAGRCQPDGLIEFLGRRDDQVKIRGFRIELGEIETVLQEDPEVAEAAVVVAAEGVPGGRLRAFVVHRSGLAGAGRGDAIREVLRRRLPDYMIPTVVSVVEALPRTSTGKVDRRQLRERRIVLTASAPDEEPLGAREELLASIWAPLLGQETISRHANFFRLGGDSILSIQMVARLRARGYALQAKDLFEAPTVAQLASRMQPVTLMASAPPPPAVQALTPAQWRFLASTDDRQLQRHWQAATVPIPRECAVDIGALATALVQRHEALRSRFQRTGNGWTPVLDTGESVNVCVERADQGEELSVTNRVLERIAARFDVSKGPLFGLGRVVTEDGSSLLLVAHHLVVDATSWRILVDDVKRAFSEGIGTLSGDGPSLGACLATAHQLYLTSNEDEEWANSAGLLGATCEPLPFGGRQSASSITIAIERTTQVLPVAQVSPLMADMAATYRARPDEVLLGGMVLGARRYPAANGLSLLLETHGRNHASRSPDSEVCGWLTAFAPLHVRWRHDDDAEQVLKITKERARRAAAASEQWSYRMYRSGAGTHISHSGPPPEPVLRFNFLGSRATNGEFHESSLGVPASGIDVTAEIVGGELQVEWSWRSDEFARDDIEGFAAAFKEGLAEVAAIARSGRPGYTPSDFPLAGLSQELLDQYLAGIHNVVDVYPLTAMQQGLLFHSLYRPDSQAYHVQMLLTLEGEIDTARLRAAFTAVFARHAALRTKFVWQTTSPLQVVLERAEPPWRECDLQDLTKEEQSAAVAAEVARQRQSPFALDQAPLSRLVCFRLATSRVQVLWAQHHILMDGWSLAHVMHEVEQLYARRPLPAAWSAHRAFVRALGDGASGDTEFWQAELAGVSEPCYLSKIDAKHWVASDGSQQSLKRALPLRINAAAAAAGLTANTLCQGAWALTLAAFTGKPEVMFGVTVSGRRVDALGTEDAVGLFINTLPLRVAMSAELGLDELLTQLQEKTLRLNDSSRMSLAQIQRLAGFSGQGLFDTLFVFENYPTAGEPRVAREWACVDVQMQEMTEYPLTVTIIPRNDWSVEFAFTPIVFSPELIESVADSFVTALSRVVDALDHGDETQ
jgi:amino acid adenylation domain-containing protein/non-ribosomal peptide synthase protein (TIGR01720 family)